MVQRVALTPHCLCSWKKNRLELDNSFISHQVFLFRLQLQAQSRDRCEQRWGCLGDDDKQQNISEYAESYPWKAAMAFPAHQQGETKGDWMSDCVVWAASQSNPQCAEGLFNRLYCWPTAKLTGLPTGQPAQDSPVWVSALTSGSISGRKHPMAAGAQEEL